ncbi:hypothetical protein [Flavicella sediminum]|nr:hypothetical protein [Flavicella sediminum]
MTTYGINPEKPIYIELSGLIGNSFLALGCFWELYVTKKDK